MLSRTVKVELTDAGQLRSINCLGVSKKNGLPMLAVVKKAPKEGPGSMFLRLKRVCDHELKP